jgi:hypothetical protein
MLEEQRVVVRARAIPIERQAELAAFVGQPTKMAGPKGETGLSWLGVARPSRNVCECRRDPAEAGATD